LSSVGSRLCEQSYAGHAAADHDSDVAPGMPTAELVAATLRRSKIEGSLSPHALERPDRLGNDSLRIEILREGGEFRGVKRADHDGRQRPLSGVSYSNAYAVGNSSPGMGAFPCRAPENLNRRGWHTADNGWWQRVDPSPRSRAVPIDLGFGHGRQLL